MDVKAVLSAVKDTLKTDLFTIGDVTVSPGSLVVFAAVLFVAYVVSKIAKRGIRRFFENKDLKTKANAYILQRITHYVIMLVGVVAAMQTIGIDLSTIFAAGAVFAVGLGFAMQNISQNFVSGLILLLERTIKQGDVIEVKDTVVRVERIGIRSTLVRTRGDEELIVPNATLVQDVVKNYTMSNSTSVVGTEIGVSYHSDLQLVRKVLEDVVQGVPWRADVPPRVLLLSFGASAVIFGVYVTVQDPWAAKVFISDLNEAIWNALKEASITIAFPQLDVHFDPNVTKVQIEMSKQNAQAGRD
jgi:small-conductance mechanosensitive channel